MKKDFFEGKIKPEYHSYITSSVIGYLLIFSALAILFFFFSTKTSEVDTKITLIILSCASLFFGMFLAAATIFVVRKYPKYKALRRFVLNSDYYFVGVNDKTYCGDDSGRNGRKNRIAFEMVTHIADANVYIPPEKYPKKFKVYSILMKCGIPLLFINILIFAWCSKNLSDMQLGIVFLILAVLEIALIIALFIIAFKIRKIRKSVIEKYKTER